MGSGGRTLTANSQQRKKDKGRAIWGDTKKPQKSLPLSKCPVPRQPQPRNEPPQPHHPNLVKALHNFERAATLWVWACSNIFEFGLYTEHLVMLKRFHLRIQLHYIDISRGVQPALNGRFGGDFAAFYVRMVGILQQDTLQQDLLNLEGFSEDEETEAVREILDPNDQWSSVVRMVYANTLPSAFDHGKGSALNELVLQSSKHLTRIGIICDRLADDGSYKYSQQAHSVVQRLFNTSLKGARGTELFQRETSVGIINCLFKLNSEMGRVGSMTTIIVNLQNVLGARVDILTDTRFSTAQRCTYAYFTGIENFQNAQFFKAATNLQASFDLCHPSFLKNRRKILIHLLVSNLIIGRFPGNAVYSLPEAAQFRDVFTPIVQAIKIGHFSAFEKAIYRSKKWLLHFGIYHDLEIRCEALLWRNLLKNVFAVSGSTTKSGIESVSMEKIREAALAFRADLKARVSGLTASGETVEFRETLKESAILSVVLGLIDNGWINGYVSVEKGILAGWSSKTRLITRLADVKNQYVGMLWGGERGTGVTEKETNGDKEKDNGNTIATSSSTAPTAPIAPMFGTFPFASVPANSGFAGAVAADAEGEGYGTDMGDDMEMEL
ncbi:hypothetical protein ABW19_dt0208617 [Dactylella cylindrospora]|nr:hypothetical protein ABW19_dt0208617 [Dactylella cylindrospora]